MQPEAQNQMLASWQSHFDPSMGNRLQSPTGRQQTLFTLPTVASSQKQSSIKQPSMSDRNQHEPLHSLAEQHPHIRFARPLDVQIPPTLSSDSSFISTHPELEKQDCREEVWRPGRAEWMVMLTLTFTSLIVALDSTILVPVLPTLAFDLHGTAQEAFWTGTSYLLVNAVFQPVLAAISDIFGRKEVLLPSVVSFLVGSIICGWSQNFATLLVGRVIQGIGGAGIMTLAQIIYADIVPLRQRPKYFALVLSAWGVGSVLGPLIGGAFVQESTWRWCFWLNIPICVVALVLVFLYVNLSTSRASLMDKVLRVDWIGSFLFVASLTSFLVAISWAGVQYSWSSWHTLVPLIIGIVGMTITIAWEMYGASHPLLIRELFKRRSAIVSYLCAMIQGIALYMTLYYLPFYFTAALGASPLKSGVDLLPACICLLPGSAIVSALITRLGRYRGFIWSGWALGTIGAGLFIMFDEKTHTAVWAVALCVFGIGMGMVLSSINFSVQACVEPIDAGRAAAMYAFMRNVGMSLGVAIGGSVFQNFMKHELRAQGLPDIIAVNAEGLVHQLWDRSVTSEAQFDRIIPAYVHGFQGVFIVLTAISGVALLLGFFIKHFNMDKMLESRFSITK